MAEGLAAFLDDGHIIAFNRRWVGCDGDIDCVVAGSLDGQPVVIIGEAKTNMLQTRVETVILLNHNFVCMVTA